jgi:hypothetical protein
MVIHMHSAEATYETISNVAKLFYQLKTDEGIRKLAEIAGLITGTLRHHQVSDEDMQQVQAILNECMTAYQHKEYILLADLIQYELAQIFAP